MAAVMLLVVNCGEAASQQATIKIKPEQKLQVMKGWEATAQAAESYSRAFDNYKEKLSNARE